jgi:hypothetical protein
MGVVPFLVGEKKSGLMIPKIHLKATTGHRTDPL